MKRAMMGPTKACAFFVLLSQFQAGSSLRQAPAKRLAPTKTGWSLGKRSPALPTKPTPPPLNSFETGLLKTCGTGWLALTPMALLSSKAITTDIFGLATDTFEANLREPAAGFLEITSALFPLEGALLFALAGVGGLSMIQDDRARIGGAVSGVSAISLLTLASAITSGATVTDAPALTAFTLLVAISGFVGIRATEVVEPPCPFSSLTRRNFSYRTSRRM